MASIKTLLTNGKICKCRNGKIFTIMYNNDKEKCLVNNQTIIPLSSYDLKTYKNSLSSEFDIIAIVSPRDFNHNLGIIAGTFTDTEFDEIDLIWKETPKEDIPSTPVAPESNDSADGYSPIQIQTKVWIAINGKPVDLQDLSNDERDILRSFGIIS